MAMMMLFNDRWNEHTKKTKAMDMRVLSVRNKIEDGKVIPIYIRTALMVADIGTKALDQTTFEFLRDLLCGYAGKSSEDDAMAMMMLFNDRWNEHTKKTKR